MAQATAIEWTDVSWNPVHGCSKVSPGCAHCYAETLSRRYGQTPKPWTPANAVENVILKPHKLREPLSNAHPWDKPCRVFVNSMSDLFHELVPDEYIGRVFDVMGQARRHTFQVLTKRPDRMRAFVAGVAGQRHCDTSVWPLPNVWLGTSIENRRYVRRADYLRCTPAAVRFISAEPLLGPLFYDDYDSWEDDYDGPSLTLNGIDWLIAGGESGPGHRPVDPEWVRQLRDACLPSCGFCERVEGVCQCERPELSGGSTAFFFKQWGGARPGGEALLDGREWREFPEVTNA